MDAEKLRQLEALQYTIPPVCGLCVSAFFYQNDALFGSCQSHHYSHVKHTGPTRPLSICRIGVASCAFFELDPTVMAKLGGFSRFVDTPQKIEAGSLPDRIRARDNDISRACPHYDLRDCSPFCPDGAVCSKQPLQPL